MTWLSTIKVAEEVAKDKNNANEAVSTRTMPNEVAKHKNNANEIAKQDNDRK